MNKISKITTVLAISFYIIFQHFHVLIEDDNYRVIIKDILYDCTFLFAFISISKQAFKGFLFLRGLTILFILLNMVIPLLYDININNFIIVPIFIVFIYYLLKVRRKKI